MLPANPSPPFRIITIIITSEQYQKPRNMLPIQINNDFNETMNKSYQNLIK